MLLSMNLIFPFSILLHLVTNLQILLLIPIISLVHFYFFIPIKPLQYWALLLLQRAQFLQHLLHLFRLPTHFLHYWVQFLYYHIQTILTPLYLNPIQLLLTLPQTQFLLCTLLSQIPSTLHLKIQSPLSLLIL